MRDQLRPAIASLAPSMAGEPARGGFVAAPNDSG